MHDDGTGDVEPHAAAAGLLDLHGRILLGETPLQQQQAHLEIVLNVGQAQLRRQAQLAIGKFAAAAAQIFTHEFPEDRAGDAADQIDVIEKHAVVALVAAQADGGSGFRR